MNKRGQEGISVMGTTLGIILAILGFIILVAAVYMNFSASDSEDQVCKLSVLGRGSTSDGALGGAVKGYIPLKCTTKKICITDSKDKCGDFAGEENVVTEKLKGTSQAKAREIERISVESMYNCWNLMGRGRIDIFDKSTQEYFGLSYSNSTCFICSRIAVSSNFDKDALKLVDINRYIAEENVPGDSGITYLQYFSDDRSVSAFTNVDVDRAESAESESSNQVAIVFMQTKPINSETIFENLQVAGLTGTAVVFTTPGVSQAASIVSKIPYAIPVALIAAAGVTGISIYNVHESKVVASAYCGTFAGKEEGSKGCSIMQMVDYDAKKINSFCHSLQGNQ